MKSKTHYNSGYATLVTVLILTMALLMIASTLTMSNLASTAGGEEISAKEQSYFLAYTCLDVTRYRLNGDLNYLGNEIVVVEDQQCQILPTERIDSGGTGKNKGRSTRITVTANVHNNKTTLQMILDTNLSPTSFAEL